MSFSDTEVLGTNDASEVCHGERVRPRSAPCRALPTLDLEQMTQEAVELFRSGQQQAALDLAMEFCSSAEALLGRTHSTYVNALATVAAFAEQMGCTKEARELLQEAEELHQEQESLPFRSRSDSENEVSEGHSEGSEEAEAEKIEQLTWEIQEFLKDGHPELAAKLLAEAEIGLLGGVGDGEGSQNESDQTLLGLKKAALHTLWAAVLEDIGEKDKAAKLYDEALTCLKHQDEQDFDSASAVSDTNVSDASHRSSPDPLELHQQQRPLPIAEKMKLLMEREVPDQNGEREVASESPKPKLEAVSNEAPESLVKGESEQSQSEQNESEQSQSKEVNEAKEVNEMGQLSEVKDAKDAEDAEDAKDVMDALEPKTAPPTASMSPVATMAASPAAPAAPAAPAPKTSSPVPKTPKTPKSPTTSGSVTAPQTPYRAVTPAKAPKKRPAPMAPMAPKVSSGGAVRVGGGFRLAPPKAPPGRPTAKAPRKPKAKATPTPATTATVQAAQLPEAFDMETKPEEEMAKVSDLLSRLTTSAQKAMVTADHFLGLSKLERAADILEEQLTEISSEASPLRNSDLHIKLLQKYGGILWWDGDAEGAIDAYAAADEVLTERAEAEKDPGLLLQRAKLWGQVAQVHRKSRDLEEADRHLEAAIYSLEQLRDHPSGSTSRAPVGLEELLKDLQASLGQVCVEKKEYGRAQELYLMAFSAFSDSDRDRSPGGPA